MPNDETVQRKIATEERTVERARIGGSKYVRRRRALKKVYGK
jgi:hypothetical protein